MGFDNERTHHGSNGPAAAPGTHATPGKRTQVELLPGASGGNHGGASAQPGATTSGSGGVSVSPPQAPSIEAVRGGLAVIVFGEQGHSVEQIQNHLKHVGKKGNFDKATLEAVKVFQAAHDLVVDGVVGERTINKLIPVSGGIPAAPPSGGLSPWSSTSDPPNEG
jgi:peptidoglycan hydrolase-like protein with peptidoglycan-binding domain